jgi:hypothetical protein
VNALVAVLTAAARHGRHLLVAGLIAGVGLPGLAEAMRDWLQELVALLMFVAALRIGPRQAFSALADLGFAGALTVAYQLALPLVAIGAFHAAGIAGTPVATALILMATASPISGSPNLTILSGGNPAPALRLLVVATALLPLTVIPVFLLAPSLGSPDVVLAAAGRLLALIVVATGGAFLLRHHFLPDPSPRTVAAIDGLSAIAMAIVVIGLMSEAGPTLLRRPGSFAAWLAIAFVANFGLQILARLFLARTALKGDITAYSIIAGNRNIALFLVALPREITDPILLFIGCYQIPMYLTPLLMGRFYAGRGPD